MLRQRCKQAQMIARLKNLIPSPPRSVEDDKQLRILSEPARFGPNNFLSKVTNFQELLGQNEEKITTNNYLPADTAYTIYTFWKMTMCYVDLDLLNILLEIYKSFPTYHCLK